MIDILLSIALLLASLAIILLNYEMRKMKRLIAFIGGDLAKRGYLGQELKNYVEIINNKMPIKG
jgi:hypothetical protein